MLFRILGGNPSGVASSPSSVCINASATDGWARSAEAACAPMSALTPSASKTQNRPPKCPRAPADAVLVDERRHSGHHGPAPLQESVVEHHEDDVRGLPGEAGLVVPSELGERGGQRLLDPVLPTVLLPEGIAVKNALVAWQQARCPPTPAPRLLAACWSPIPDRPFYSN